MVAVITNMDNVERALPLIGDLSDEMAANAGMLVAFRMPGQDPNGVESIIKQLGVNDEIADM